MYLGEDNTMQRRTFFIFLWKKRVYPLLLFLLLLLFYAGRLVKRLWQKLQSIVPQKLLNILALLLLGAMFYHYWEKDRWLLLFFGGYLAVKIWVELLAAEQKNGRPANSVNGAVIRYVKGCNP